MFTCEVTFVLEMPSNDLLTLLVLPLLTTWFSRGRGKVVACGVRGGVALHIIWVRRGIVHIGGGRGSGLRDRRGRRGSRRLSTPAITSIGRNVLGRATRGRSRRAGRGGLGFVPSGGRSGRIGGRGSGGRLVDRGVVTLSEDPVLSAVSETPLIEIVGGIILVVEHVVTLGLEPVHWLLSALVALGKITSAPLGNHGLGNGSV
jgi:hypothetical protein